MALMTPYAPRHSLNTGSLGAATSSGSGRSRLPSLQQLGGQGQGGPSDMMKFGADFMFQKAKLENSIQQNSAMMEYRRANLDQNKIQSDRTYKLQVDQAESADEAREYRKTQDLIANEQRDRTFSLNQQQFRTNRHNSGRTAMAKSIETEIATANTRIGEINDSITSSGSEGSDTRVAALKKQQPVIDELNQDRVIALAALKDLTEFSSNYLDSEGKGYDQLEPSAQQAYWPKADWDSITKAQQSQNDRSQKLTKLKEQLEATRVFRYGKRLRGPAVLKRIERDIVVLEDAYDTKEKIRLDRIGKADKQARIDYEKGIVPDFLRAYRRESYDLSDPVDRQQQIEPESPEVKSLPLDDDKNLTKILGRRGSRF
jgi:hypothetical protein